MDRDGFSRSDRVLSPAMRIIRMAVFSVLAAAALAGQEPPDRVFVGARLIDGTGAKPIENAVIVVRGDRIAQVSTMSEPGTVPADAERIDLRGKTVMPGFVNAHGHVADTSGLKAGPEFYTRSNLERQLTLYARYGVTTVFSLGGDGPDGVALKKEAPSGRARLFVAGPVIAATTAEAAAADVEKLAAMGVDWLKFRVDDNLGSSKKMPKEAWKTVIDRGHAKNIPVAAHLFYLEDAKDLLREGVDLIAHSVRDAAVDDEFIRLAKARDVCVVPTLTREVSTFVYESTPPWFSDEFFLRHADPTVVEQLKEPTRQAQMRKSASAQRYKAALEVASKNLKALKDAGVRIAFGTDTGPPARFQGYFEHLELELMVKAGLTPMDAIVAATGDAARCMKNTSGLGTIKAGAPADFVVYRDDPSKDIKATRTLESVWIAGTKMQDAARPSQAAAVRP
jgi:imidazolonepropionase-like amidohydrolase